MNLNRCHMFQQFLDWPSLAGEEESEAPFFMLISSEAVGPMTIFKNWPHIETDKPNAIN